MAGPSAPILYPVMWARDAGASFLRPPAEMRAVMEAAGFRVRAWDDITAETAQVVEAIRKAVEEGTSGAQAKIAELEALVVTLREQIAAGEDPTETLAMIDAGQAELRTAVQSIIADVLPDPQTTSRRR